MILGNFPLRTTVRSYMGYVRIFQYFGLLNISAVLNTHRPPPSGGFKVGGPEARLKRGPSDEVSILSQP